MQKHQHDQLQNSHRSSCLTLQENKAFMGWTFIWRVLSKTVRAVTSSAISRTNSVAEVVRMIRQGSLTVRPRDDSESRQLRGLERI